MIKQEDFFLFIKLSLQEHTGILSSFSNIWHSRAWAMSTRSSYIKTRHTMADINKESIKSDNFLFLWWSTVINSDHTLFLQELYFKFSSEKHGGALKITLSKLFLSFGISEIYYKIRFNSSNHMIHFFTLEKLGNIRDHWKITLPWNISPPLGISDMH